MLWEELSSYFTYTGKEKTIMNELFYLHVFFFVPIKPCQKKRKKNIKREMSKDYRNNRNLKIKLLTRAEDPLLFLSRRWRLDSLCRPAVLRARAFPLPCAASSPLTKVVIHRNEVIRKGTHLFVITTKQINLWLGGGGNVSRITSKGTSLFMIRTRFTYD